MNEGVRARLKSRRPSAENRLAHHAGALELELFSSRANLRELLSSDVRFLQPAGRQIPEMKWPKGHAHKPEDVEVKVRKRTAHLMGLALE